jgi:hypothetical protein
MLVKPRPISWTGESALGPAFLIASASLLSETARTIPATVTMAKRTSVKIVGIEKPFLNIMLIL